MRKYSNQCMSTFAGRSRFLFLFLLAFSMQVHAQVTPASDKKGDLRSAMTSRNFYFQAQSAKAINGGNQILRQEFFLQISHDTLMVNLPYYDYYFATNEFDYDDPVEFTTTQFTYSADSTKKGGWNVIIKPMGQDEAGKISMSVSGSGYCNMYVTPNIRQPMTFYGVIMALKD